ncbi:MAG: hypothetical protein M3Z59_05725 [Bombella apis]|nr:hypothetical protein [Bombella apis]
MLNVPYNEHRESYRDRIEQCDEVEDVTATFLEMAAGLALVSKNGRRRSNCYSHPYRMFCATSCFKNDWVNVLPKIVSRRNPDTGAELQVLEAISAYCSGVKMVYPQQIRDINPIAHRCWELKTPDVRVYGWFVVKDFFVAHRIEDARKTHLKGRGYRCVQEGVIDLAKFREGLPSPFNGFLKDGGTSYAPLSNKIR